MEDKVILDVMDDAFLPKRRWPDFFVFISLLEVCHVRGGVKKGGLGGC